MLVRPIKLNRRLSGQYQLHEFLWRSLTVYSSIPMPFLNYLIETGKRRGQLQSLSSQIFLSTLHKDVVDALVDLEIPEPKQPHPLYGIQLLAKMRPIFGNNPISMRV